MVNRQNATSQGLAKPVNTDRPVKKSVAFLLLLCAAIAASARVDPRSARDVARMLDVAGGFAVANLLRDLGDGVDFDTAFAHRIQRSFADFQASLASP